MKTIENNSGNRKQKREQTKKAVILLILILICTALTGQGIWRGSIVGQEEEVIAMLWAGYASAEEVPFTDMSDYMFLDAEVSLEIESWMTDMKYFNPYAQFLEIAPEPEMEVEEWMLNEEYFVKSYMPEVNEETLKVEGWMVDGKCWGWPK